MSKETEKSDYAYSMETQLKGGRSRKHPIFGPKVTEEDLEEERKFIDSIYPSMDAPKEEPVPGRTFEEKELYRRYPSMRSIPDRPELSEKLQPADPNDRFIPTEEPEGGIE